MSSILTNSSAMVALETLRGINKGMDQVQNEISTGKKISSAKDNAAVYAIATVMSSDVSSFDKISDSLNLGNATVGVARAAAEQVVDILTQMKGLIVSAQEDNVDRSKIQTDVGALKAQIDTIVGAAQFNGSNLIQGAGDVDFLASLDRASDGTVTASNITVAKVSLETNGTITGVAADAGGVAGVGEIGFATISDETPADAAVSTVTFKAGAIQTGDVFEVTVGGTDLSYTAVDGDTLTDVTAALTTSIGGEAGWTATVVAGADPEANDAVITITNGTGGASTIAAETTDVAVTEVVAKDAGGLAALDTLTVATEVGATSALAAIEGVLATAIDAAAAFGSAQKRIGMQDEFVNSLMDAMKIGIGAMVDADMEEASARLQSLQVQQQLGTQSLSIANKAPQSLLSLFRS